MLTPETPDPRDVAELPYDLTDRAIGRWAEAQREADEAARLADGRPDLEKWAGLAATAAIDAEQRLVVAILAWSPDFDGVGSVRPGKRRCPARGVRSEGRLFLAVSDRCQDGEDGGGELDLMRLAVVESSAVVDLADILDDIEEDHSPAPPPLPLDDWEKSLLKIMRDIGEGESWDRLLMAGPYGYILDAIRRLGTDAVAQLRKLAREAEDAESGVIPDRGPIRRDTIEGPPPLEDAS